MEIKAQKLLDLEKVFELPISKTREIKKNRAENKLLKVVWDMVSVVKLTFAHWKKTLWNDINTDILTSETNKLRLQIMALPADVRQWNVYEGLMNDVKNLARMYVTFFYCCFYFSSLVLCLWGFSLSGRG